MMGRQPARVGVADGRYRLKTTSSGWERSSSPDEDPVLSRLSSLITIDYDTLPAEIEVRGGTVELPPIPARVRKELVLLEPRENAPVNLREVVFRWSAVEGAATNRVVFIVVAPDGRMRTFFAFFDIPGTSLRLGALTRDPDGDLAGIRENFKPGVHGEWKVDALDASGKNIGTMIGNTRPFLVARGLAGAP